MKKLLILGDSIAMNFDVCYFNTVKKLLEGKAEVVGPSDNCRFAKYTLWYINEWVNTFGKPDIIHWNNGIWDVYTQNEEMGIFTCLDDYITDMKRVYMELRKTGAIIIFATTTPIKGNIPCLSDDDVNRYNKKIVHELSFDNVIINDLYTLVKNDIENMICDDGYHLSEFGAKAVGTHVAGFISEYL